MRSSALRMSWRRATGGRDVPSQEAFYSLPSGDQVEAQRQLAQSALQQWDLGAVDELELLAERENAVFAATTSSGKVVTRVHRAGYHSDAQLRSQHLWTGALMAARVVDTAPWVLTRSGEPFAVVEHPAVPEPRQVSVLEFVAGEQLSIRLDSPDSDTATVAAAYGRLGALAAHVHDQGASWERPPGFDCVRWDAKGLVGERPVWGSFWDLESLTAEQTDLMRDFRDRARSELDEMGDGPELFGLVHNDFLPENLLVSGVDRGEEIAGPTGPGEPEGERLCLLDFDDMGDGWFLFDIATALVAVATREDFPAVRDAFLDRYRDVRPLAHAESLPVFFALRLATYAGWMQSRRHTQFARDIGEIVIGAAVDIVGRYMAGELDV